MTLIKSKGDGQIMRVVSPASELRGASLPAKGKLCMTGLA
jgi:hypothetical protein